MESYKVSYAGDKDHADYVEMPLQLRTNKGGLVCTDSTQKASGGQATGGEEWTTMIGCSIG